MLPLESVRHSPGLGDRRQGPCAHPHCASTKYLLPPFPPFSYNVRKIEYVENDSAILPIGSSSLRANRGGSHIGAQGGGGYSPPRARSLSSRTGSSSPSRARRSQQKGAARGRRASSSRRKQAAGADAGEATTPITHGGHNLLQLTKRNGDKGTRKS